jgi:hypothetical protein
MWMKLINRIIFALIMAMGLLFVYSRTDQYVRSNELIAQANKALSEENYQHFISVRFYQEVPLLEEEVTVDNTTYRLFLYETAFIRLVNDNYEVVDGFVFLLFLEQGPLLDLAFQVKISTTEETLIDYIGHRVLDLPVYLAKDQETKAFLFPRSEFYVDSMYQEITKMDVFVSDELYFSLDLQIEESTYSIKSQIEEYLLANNKVPHEDFGSVRIQKVIQIDTAPYVLRNGAIYLVAVFGVTVLFYGYRNKQLGKKEPTIGVQKDIEKLKQKQK